MVSPGATERGSGPLKRRRTDSPPPQPRRYQKPPTHTEPALQDPVLVQGQLLRSISAALAAAGFDSVRPSALEAFRAEAEEYMLHLLLVVKDAMASARRTQVTREDFDIAFAAMDISTSSLQPHVDLKFPSPLAHTRIPPPRPAEPPPPDLAPMLGPQLAGLQQRVQQPYIPHHFPPLPSRHTWQNTPVFTEREKDPRKIRERATEEGILAEQALRKLTAANRSRSRIGKGSSAKDKKKEQLWQETMGELLNEEGGEARKDRDGDLVLDFGADGPRDGTKKAESLNGGGSMLVNYDSGHWRRGAPLVR